MGNPLRFLRRQPKEEKKRPRSAESGALTTEKIATVTKKTIVHHLPSIPSRPKEPPRLELPLDFHNNPFSKATYSPPCSPPYSDGHKLRRIQALDDLSSSAFRLMDLPTELRLNILTQYFGKKTMPINMHATAPAQKRFFSLVHKGNKLNVVAVLQSCRRLSKEASEVLWNSTTFIMRIADHFSLAKQPRPIILLQRVRHIVLHVGCVPRDSIPELEALLELLPSLKTADVHFDFTAPDIAYPWQRNQIIEAFGKALKTERLMRVSCVSHDLTSVAPLHWYHNKEMRNLVPYSCPSLQELKQRYHPHDVSVEECGRLMPKLSNGDMCEWDTGLLEVAHDSI